MDEYLRQVFFVDEISIVGVDMDKLKVTTLLKGSFNVFAFARMNFFDRKVKEMCDWVCCYPALAG